MRCLSPQKLNLDNYLNDLQIKKNFMTEAIDRKQFLAYSERNFPNYSMEKKLNNLLDFFVETR